MIKHFYYKILILMCLIALFGISSSITYAVNFVNRSSSVNTLQEERKDVKDGEMKWFLVNGGWAELSKYAFKLDEDHYWNCKIGSIQEFFRVGNDMALAFMADMEIVVDKHSQIMNFNPRAVFWELGALLSFKYSFGYLSFGYSHRCKHEIDRLANDLDQGRVFIYDSFALRYMTNPIRLWSSGDMSGSIQFIANNNYFLVLDGKSPKDTIETIMDSLSLSAYINLLRYKDDWSVYFNTGIEPTAYGDGEDFKSRNKLDIDRIKPDWFMELGYSVMSNTSKFDFFVLYQYLYDTGVPDRPRSAFLMSFGIRYLPNF